MSRYRRELFPISIFHSSVEDNQKLKDLIVPYIESCKEKLSSSSPEGWLTTNIITSFEDDELNHIFFDNGEISNEVRNQYINVLKTFFDQNWETDIDSMWFNYYDNGQYQESHTHMGKYNEPIHFACVHFLSYDSSVHSPLTFTDPISRLRSTSIEFKSTKYGEKCHVKAKEGDLIMFPCYLEHEVKSGPPTPNNPRITISFNIKVLKYGDE